MGNFATEPKIFINKKKYRAHARASVLFLNIQNKNNKSKENKKR